MDSRNELYEWEANLRNELRGLNFCKDKVRSDADIPLEVKQKFLGVTSTLKQSVSRLIHKCKKLSSSHATDKNFPAKLKQLKEEYIATFKDISDLLATVDGSPGPTVRHQHSTFTSRQMTKAKPPAVPSDRTAALQAGLETMDHSVKKIKKKLAKHSTGECQQVIQSLSSQNKQLSREVKQLKEEQTELRMLVNRLQQQVESLEPADEETSLSRERFLLPRKD